MGSDGSHFHRIVDEIQCIRERLKLTGNTQRFYTKTSRQKASLDQRYLSLPGAVFLR